MEVIMSKLFEKTTGILTRLPWFYTGEIKNPLLSREKEVKNEQFSEETAQGNKSHLRSKNARCKPT